MRSWGRWLPLGLVVLVAVVSMAYFLGEGGGSRATSNVELADEKPAPTTDTLTTGPVAESAVVSVPSVDEPAPLGSSTTIATTTTTTTTTSVDSTEDVPDKQAGPFVGGVATVGVLGPAETLNPFIAPSGVASAVGSLTWASAFVLDGETYDLRPSVIVELPTFDSGGLRFDEDGRVVVRLDIDPRAQWADGRPITASDFAFTANTLATDRRVAADVRERYQLIDRDTEFVSGLVYEFTLETATIEYLRLFEIILPAHQMSGTDLFRDWDDEVWLSAGPFSVAERGDDGSTRLVRNDAWQLGSDLAYLDEILVVGFEGPGDVVSALNEKMLSVGELGLDHALASTRDDVVIDTASGDEWEHVGFQFGRGRFAANPRSLVESAAMRRLIGDLIGQDALAVEIGGASFIPSSSIVHGSWPGAVGAVDESAAPTIDDVAAELELDFAEDPPRMVYTTTNSLDRSQMAGVALRELAALGVAVDVELEDPGLFFRDFVIPGEFEVAQWAWTITPGPVGAVNDLQDWFGRANGAVGLDFYGWAASAVDETLLERIRGLDGILELDALQAELAAVDTALLEASVVVPLWQRTAGSARDPLRLGGFIQPKAGVPITWNGYLWSVPGGCDDLPDGTVCGGVILPSAAG